jgi:hypothetical protein
MGQKTQGLKPSVVLREESEEAAGSVLSAELLTNGKSSTQAEPPRKGGMEATGAASQPSAPQTTHPAVAPLAFLLGKWRGEGEGSFPTISSFRYGEELLFSHHPSKACGPLYLRCFPPEKIFPSAVKFIELFLWLTDRRWWVAAASDLVHAEDVEDGVWRADARQERVLAAPP